jgi:hypothetical protein
MGYNFFGLEKKDLVIFGQILLGDGMCITIGYVL